MKFVIQQNLLNADQIKQVFGSVSKYPHVGIDMVPFQEGIISTEPLIGTDFIPYGSTLFTKEASRLGWKGLFFDLDQMNYRTALKNTNHMLNDGLYTVTEAIEFLKKQDPKKEWFTRPSNDLKQFSGQVIDTTALWLWLESMIELTPEHGSYYMNKTDEIILCEPKMISAEWRWFIVGGKIVSGSMYRAHNQLRKLQETDQSVIKEAQQFADVWLPHPCVVMDTALVGDKIKVVEYNCINSSGFYDNDVPAIFDALWDYCKDM